MENTVIKVLTIEHGKKVIEWWQKQGIDTRDLMGIGCESDGDNYIYYGIIEGKFDNWNHYTVKLYNAKIIKLPAEEEFDMTTNEGRLAYAKKHYPVGTRYISPEYSSKVFTVGEEAIKGTQYWLGAGTYKDCVVANSGGDTQTGQFICYFGKWAEIINEVKQEEKVMETQRLSRQGLKEIHSVACDAWKEILEKYGANNPLEDYIELTQAQVDTMFNSCTKEQLPIVSKYLKQDDGSVDVKKLDFISNHLIAIRQGGEYKHKAFGLNTDYDWILKFDNEGELCLIPTKKK